MSLLESFAEAGAFLTIATTHHGELKTLKYRYYIFFSWRNIYECHELNIAFFRVMRSCFWKFDFNSNDVFENASMEFDEVNLKPTYKILWGVPGYLLYFFN